MMNVGLTGNIAAGKSTVASLFARWGATVIDADALVREVQGPGSPVLRAIRDRFGPEVMQQDDALDRAALRRMVTDDPEALAALNAIVHPAVGRLRSDRLSEAKAAGDLIVINDIPLLFEVLDPAAFDVIVLVDAPEETRLARLTGPRALSSHEADRLVGAQMASAAKRPQSRFVIDNVGSLGDLERTAWDVWCAIRHEAASELLPGGGCLLALFAHPDDESFAMGGTLARYADAGADVHVWCATAGESGTLNGAAVAESKLRTVRAHELTRAAEILGVNIERCNFPDDGLAPDDADGIAAVADALRRLQPDVVVTFGPDGVTGHSDHLAVHSWVTRAWRQLESTGRLYYVTYPELLTKTFARDWAGRPHDEIAARIDVRPWRDSKRAAIEAHASQTFPISLDEPPGDQLLDREWFATSEPSGDCVGDLFAAHDRA